MAIAFDAASSGTSTATTCSWSHTIGSGSNRLLVVGVMHEITGTGSITGVTYNGVAMTQLGSTLDFSEVSSAYIAYFYMLEASLPAAGTYTVEATTSGGTSPTNVCGAVSLTGVSQAAPEASNRGNTGVDGTTFSTNVTTIANNAWVVDVIGDNSNHTWTADGGQTERVDAANAGGTVNSIAMSTKPVATAGATTLGWTTSGTYGRIGQIVASFAPASAAADFNYPKITIVTL